MKSRARITVVIADDHPVFRMGLKEIVQMEDGCDVVAEAGDGEEALAAIRRHQPTVAVLDVEMPRASGLDVVRALQEESVATAPLILTMYQQESIFNKAMELGVTGYILKDSAAADIVRGIIAVAEGRYFVSPFLMEYALKDRQSTVAQQHSTSLIVTLTETERKVLRMIADSRTTRAIAADLFISPRTVDAHRRNISAKLGLGGTYTLLRFAIANREML